MTGRPEPSALTRRLVRCYPPSWRDRYGEEYLALLAETGLGPRAALDVVTGALDAWLRPRRSVLSGAPRLRATVSVVWCAWIALAAGTLIFGQITEDGPFRAADGAHPWLGAIYLTYVTAAHVSVLAVLAGALPLTWALWRDARRTGRRRAALLLGLPVAASAAFLAILVAVARLVPHSPVPGVGIGAFWFGVLVLVGLAAGVACAAGPAVALRRLAAPGGLLRVAVLAAVPATATMTIAVLASTAYGVALPHVSGAPPAPAAADPALLAAYAAVMALACAAAWTSTARGLLALAGRGA